MANGLKVKADASAVQRSMTRLQSLFDDMRPVLNNAARELTRRIRYRFNFKRDPDGNKWSPWSPATRARYRRNPNRKLMLHTRQLRDNSRFIAGKRDLRAVFGTPYGVYHEQPNRGASGDLPRRAFMLSVRNGKRALAVNDEKYLLNSLRYQIQKAADQ